MLNFIDDAPAEGSPLLTPEEGVWPAWEMRQMAEEALNTRAQKGEK